MLAICNRQPNWMPRRPKFMLRICRNDFADGQAR